MNSPIIIGGVHLCDLTPETMGIINWKSLFVHHDPNNVILKFALENIPKTLLSRQRITMSSPELLKNEEAIQLYLQYGFNVNWQSISYKPFLTEHFIETYIDKLCLQYIASTYILTKQFITKHKDKFSPTCFYYNKPMESIIKEVYNL
jgi:hypothetical protein